MRILHIYRTYFPDQTGGLLEAIRQICLGTSKLGAESQIFTLTPEPSPILLTRKEGNVVRCKSLWAPASCDIGGISACLKFHELSKWADIIHFHFPWPFADILRFFSNKQTPMVMTYHSDIVRQRLLSFVYGPLMRLTLRNMAGVVATSPAYAQKSHVLRNNVLAERLHVIPLGMLDLNDGNTLTNDEEKILQGFGLHGKQFVLSLGVLRYYKGIHNLISAADMIDAKIVIAGSGPEEEKIKALVQSIGCNNVFFLGAVSDEEKIALFKGCHVFAMPSHLRSEAFGMAQLEAAMFAKPLVCCEIGSGTSFVNIDGVTGLVVPPNEPDSLAVAINTILNNPGLAAEMGQGARVRYEKMFTGDIMGEKYMQLYNTLV